MGIQHLKPLAIFTLGLVLGWGSSKLWQDMLHHQKVNINANSIYALTGQIAQGNRDPRWRQGDQIDAFLDDGILPVNMVELDDKGKPTGKLFNSFGGRVFIKGIGEHIVVSIEAVPSENCLKFADMLAHGIDGISVGLETKSGQPNFNIPTNEMVYQGQIYREQQASKAKGALKAACGTDSWRTVSLYIR